MFTVFEVLLGGNAGVNPPESRLLGLTEETVRWSIVDGIICR